jgi:putative membrane protein
MPSRQEQLIFLAAALAVGLALGIAPRDRADWAAELIMPVLMVAACTIGSRWLVFSRLAYALILAHVVVQLWGGHFTYGREPVFGWLQERFGLARNHYDRLAHFALGFCLYVPIREFIVRAARVSRGWACFFSITLISAVAGWWELFEWALVAFRPALTADYLGMQGDIWDAQQDMLQGVLGALVAWPVFTRWHSRALDLMLPERPAAAPREIRSA